MAAPHNARWWALWAALTLVGLGVFAAALALPVRDDTTVLAQVRGWLQPGPASHGHHQIALACDACHTEPLGGGEVLQQACMNCHSDALKAANDKHPASKFEDPRNAFRLARIDALRCVSCHTEHRPEITQAMGVTQPADFCVHCHAGPEEMPPSHAELPFDGCTAAGCHNYHDNRALYEDFLLKHADAPALLVRRLLRERSLGEDLPASLHYPQDRFPFQPLDLAAADAPPTLRGHAAADEWLASRHAQAGVNCSACHVVGAAAPADSPPPPGAGTWLDQPPTPAACAGCHAEEAQGFGQGLHGMRSAIGLSPMQPSRARLPMHADAAHRRLDCNSCHTPHRPDLRRAAVEACTGCHADTHTQAYEGSPHHRLWQAEGAGQLPVGSGVSCASCHMPREQLQTSDGSRYGVQHNQSASLRPIEAMARPVCLNCHGLGYALDALADPALAAGNYGAPPAVHVPGIDMARAKDEAYRRSQAPSSPKPP